MTLEWYLITSTEIADMRRRLRDVERILPKDHHRHLREIAEIINTVEGRFA